MANRPLMVLTAKKGLPKKRAVFLDNTLRIRDREWVVNDGELFPVITHPLRYAFDACLRMAVMHPAWITAMSIAQVRERKGAARRCVKAWSASAKQPLAQQSSLGGRRSLVSVKHILNTSGARRVVLDIV